MTGTLLSSLSNASFEAANGSFLSPNRERMVDAMPMTRMRAVKREGRWMFCDEMEQGRHDLPVGRSPIAGLRLCPAAPASQASLAPHALRTRCEFGIPVVKVVRCEVGLKALYS